MPPALAQQNNVNGGPPDEFWLIMGGVCCGLLAVWLTIRFFFTLTVVRALNRCQPHHRSMDPGLMWVGMIPVVHLAWNFVIVTQVTEALRREFYARGWDRRGDDYGNGLGMAMSALHIAACIPYCGGLFGLGGFVCFIIYWVKVAGFSGQLAGRAYREYDDDYDDDRGDDGYDDDRRDDRRDDDRPWDRRFR